MKRSKIMSIEETISKKYADLLKTKIDQTTLCKAEHHIETGVPKPYLQQK